MEGEQLPTETLRPKVTTADYTSAAHGRPRFYLGVPSGPPGPSLGPLAQGEALTRFQGHPQHQLAPVVEGEEAADQEALRFLVPVREKPVAEVILLPSPLFLLVRRRRGRLLLLHGRPRPLLLPVPAGHRPRQRGKAEGARKDQSSGQLPAM